MEKKKVIYSPSTGFSQDFRKLPAAQIFQHLCQKYVSSDSYWYFDKLRDQVWNQFKKVILKDPSQNTKTITLINQTYHIPVLVQVEKKWKFEKDREILNKQVGQLFWKKMTEMQLPKQIVGFIQAQKIESFSALSYFLSSTTQRGYSQKRFNWDIICSSKGLKIGEILKLQQFVNNCFLNK